MRHLFVLFLAATCFALASAQISPSKTLLTIGNRQVSVGEFERIYSKNYSVNTVEKQSVDEYFDLFLKFELKVTAAIDAGLDTVKTFKQELKSYRDQLAKSYLTDNETVDRLLHEAYQRMLMEINVSHIMVKVSSDAQPADTLKAYQKIADIRKRILAGEAFEKLAVELSDDPSAKTNKGNLGYFSAFRMVYPFENGAYNTKVGEISNPVRTQFGYHLIKVHGTRPSPGEIKVAHIMVAVPQDADEKKWEEAKTKIFGLNERIKNGEDFGKLAKEFSDDQNSGRNNGELPWFGSGQMVPEFEGPAFALKNQGDISDPVKTNFGWHLIRLIEKKDVKPFDQIKNDLKTKIMRDERATITSASFVSKLKKLYKHKFYSGNLECFYSLDSTMYSGKYTPKATCRLDKPVLSIGKTAYSGYDFQKFLVSNPSPAKNIPVKTFINQSFETFTNQSFLSYEDNNLENKYDDFRNLVNEYHDGILLFNMMEQEVWGKASRDTLGLAEYYKTTWTVSQKDAKPLNEIKGLVTADYQNYLEERWLAALKNKYKVVINQELLHKIADKYKITK